MSSIRRDNGLGEERGMKWGGNGWSCVGGCCVSWGCVGHSRGDEGWGGDVGGIRGGIWGGVRNCEGGGDGWGQKSSLVPLLSGHCGGYHDKANLGKQFIMFN